MDRRASARRILPPEVLEPRLVLAGHVYPVADTLPNEDLSINGEPIVFHDVVYFRADDGVHGSELWRSDGTAAGTRMVKETAPGTSEGSMSNVGQIGGKLYFYTGAGLGYTDLWTSDGTAEGTQKIFSHSRVGAGWGLAEWQPVGNWVYMLLKPSDRGDPRRSLWRTDGTAAGTEFVMDLRDVAKLSSTLVGATDDVLFFARDGRAEVIECWSLSLDGKPELVGALPDSAIVAASGDQLFFVQAFGSLSTLYVADRNEASQRPVFQFLRDDILILEMVPFRGGVLMTMYVEATSQLWFSDGTTEGTRMLLSVAPREPLSFLSDTGEQMYVRQTNGDEHLLWITDGSVEGTSLLGSLGDRNTPMPSYPMVDRGFLYTFAFAEGRYELLRSDGRPEGNLRLTPAGWDRPELWTFGAVPLSGGRLMFFPALPGLGNRPWIWEPLAGDANLDDRVDLNDFGLLKKELGRNDGALFADIDFDGTVDLDDFAVLKSQFGATLPPPLVPAAVDGWASELGLGVAFSVAQRDGSNSDQDDPDSLRVGQSVY